MMSTADQADGHSKAPSRLYIERCPRTTSCPLRGGSVTRRSGRARKNRGRRQAHDGALDELTRAHLALGGADNGKVFSEQARNVGAAIY